MRGGPGRGADRAAGGALRRAGRAARHRHRAGAGRADGSRPRRKIPDRLLVTRLGRGLPGGTAACGPGRGAGGTVDHRPHPTRRDGERWPRHAAGRTGEAPEDPGTTGGCQVSTAGGSGVLPDLIVSRLYAAVVSDVLDDLGHRDHVLDPAIRPLGRDQGIAGWANPFLVTEVDTIAAEPYAGEIGALDDVRPGGAVLVAPPP